MDAEEKLHVMDGRNQLMAAARAIDGSEAALSLDPSDVVMRLKKLSLKDEMVELQDSGPLETGKKRVKGHAKNPGLQDYHGVARMNH